MVRLAYATVLRSTAWADRHYFCVAAPPMSGTLLAVKPEQHHFEEQHMEDLPIMDQLAELPNETYSYVLLAAIAGPLAFRLFGFKLLAQIIRPLALAVLLGGIYAKQQRAIAASRSG